MADKLEHSLATAGLAIGVSAGALLTGGDPALTAQLVGGVLTGLLIHPDLDLAENLRGGVTKLIWGLYGKLIRHRSPISHAPILGTGIRILYLSVLIVPALILLEVDVMSLLRQYSALILNWFIGLSLADTLHSAIDFSKVYRVGKKRRTTKRRSRKPQWGGKQSNVKPQ